MTKLSGIERRLAAIEAAAERRRKPLTIAWLDGTTFQCELRELYASRMTHEQALELLDR